MGTRNTPNTRATPSRDMNTHEGLGRDKLLGTGPFEWEKVSTTDARNFLVAKGFCAEDAPEVLDMNTIALALLRVANIPKLSALAADSLKMTALLLEGINTRPQEKMAADIEEIRQMIEQRPHDETTHPVDRHDIDSLVTQAIQHQYEGIQTIANKLQEQMGALENQISAMTSNKNDTRRPASTQRRVYEPMNHGLPTPYSSYADAARLGAEPIPAKLRADLAFAKARDNQVTLRSSNANEPAVWADLTEKEALAKVKIAIDAAKREDEEEGLLQDNEPTAVGVTKTRAGALVIYMANKYQAEWLRDHGTMKRFLEAFGGMVKHAKRYHMVIIQFVPVTFDPESTDELRDIETNNGLPPNAIGHARYVKPRERHSPNQRFAHVIMGTDTKDQANRILKHGICIEGKKVYARKLLTEPTRCMKCQLYNTGHMARDCPLTRDICARCAGEHRTSDCTKGDDKRECANCKTKGRPHKGHGAADRSCPTFTDHLQASLQRNPDAKYRYYPVEDDPSSWTLTREVQDEAPRDDHNTKIQEPTRFRTGLPSQTAAFTADYMRGNIQRGRQPRQTLNQQPDGMRQATLSFANHWSNTRETTTDWASEMDREYNAYQSPERDDATRTGTQKTVE
ncbi:unnamed protein product [Mycena citricolor]|uniref:Copper-fist domain-containing protein n=1 Tax=Mycena citricolor TaxID=2018698 RepID=A0AAD2K4Z2_9AGAR|nr:unnamed protein product [Mycena citricolor]